MAIRGGICREALCSGAAGRPAGAAASYLLAHQTAMRILRRGVANPGGGRNTQRTWSLGDRAVGMLASLAVANWAGGATYRYTHRKGS